MDHYLINILYVNSAEDDALLLHSHLKNFEGARFEIIWQESVEKALEYIALHPGIDVIVTENDLPGMSGVGFARKLKDLKYDIPIVFLTTSNDVSLPSKLCGWVLKIIYQKRTSPAISFHNRSLGLSRKAD